jgi:hypothetical protein
MRSLYLLSRLHFAQTVRHGAFGGIVIVTLLTHALLPALTMFALGEDAGLLKELGISTNLCAGVLIVALLTLGGSPSESGQQAIVPVLSKPVRRSVYLLSRWVGLVGALVVAMVLWTLALLLTARQGPPAHAGQPWDGPVLVGGLGGGLLGLGLGFLWSVWRRRSPGSSMVRFVAAGLGAGFLLCLVLDRDWHWALFASMDPAILEAMVLSLSGLGLLAATGILVSVILPGMVFPATIILFLAGLGLGGTTAWWSLFLPDFQLFWLGDLLYREGGRVGGGYLLKALGYGASFTGALLILSTWVFRRKEIP